MNSSKKKKNKATLCKEDQRSPTCAACRVTTDHPCCRLLPCRWISAWVVLVLVLALAMLALLMLWLLLLLLLWPRKCSPVCCIDGGRAPAALSPSPSGSANCGSLCPAFFWCSASLCHAGGCGAGGAGKPTDPLTPLPPPPLGPGLCSLSPNTYSRLPGAQSALDSAYLETATHVRRPALSSTLHSTHAHAQPSRGGNRFPRV